MPPGIYKSFDNTPMLAIESHPNDLRPTDE